MTFRTTCFVLLLSLYAGSVAAQTDFLKGYYTNHEGDTVHGLINYGSEKKNSMYCIFKPDPDSKPARLSPEDINSFAILDRDYYEKQSFESRNGETLHGFFRVLIEGDLSLLRYQSRYFAKDSRGELYEISNSHEVVDGKVRKDYKGLGMLMTLMGNCTEITKATLEWEYRTTPDFPKLFVKYNRCIGSKVTEHEKIKRRPDFTLGLQFSPAVTQGKWNQVMKDAVFEKDFSVVGGLFLSVYVPGVKENLLLMTEVVYGQYDQYAYFPSTNEVDNVTHNDLFVEYSFLKIPIFVRYGQKLFFDIGLQNYVVLDQNLKWRVESLQANDVFTKDSPVEPVMNSSGFLVGLGYKYELLGRTATSSLRFSRTVKKNHFYTPTLETLEFIQSFQLTK